MDEQQTEEDDVQPNPKRMKQVHSKRVTSLEIENNTDEDAVEKDSGELTGKDNNGHTDSDEEDSGGREQESDEDDDALVQAEERVVVSVNALCLNRSAIDTLTGGSLQDGGDRKQV